MPILGTSAYHAPSWLPGGHLQTIYPALFRRVATATVLSERLELPDGDFIDFAWSGKKAARLAILSHGLEADAWTSYIQGMAQALVRRGWDVIAWNFRGCSGEPNRLLRMYHSGETEDLHALVRHAVRNHPADSVDLIGFSLGGNLTLKYLGEGRSDLSDKIRGAVAFSVPCDLACSSTVLSRFSNRLYMERFLLPLRSKIRAKKRMFPNHLDLTHLSKIRSFREFDDRYTAPIHGFENATDYWARSSCRPFLPAIRLPALLVSAANDPFLGPDCYPVTEARTSDCFYFECPAEGGHVGFPAAAANGEYWSETRAAQFLEAI